MPRRSRVLRRWQIVALALAALGAVCVEAAATPPPAQVALVLDTSGSMKANDPKYRGQLAVQMFADMAPDADRLSIIGMATDPVVAPIQPVGEGREALKGRVRRLEHRDQTRCVEGLHAALRQLTVSPEGERFVVFLSDGECSATSQGGGLGATKVLTQLTDAGVRVFSIGLGPDVSGNADAKAWIQRMADETRGRAFFVDKAEALPSIFAEIFGLTHGSRTRALTFEPGAVKLEVEPYVQSLTLVLTPEEGGALDLGEVVGPDGRAAAALFKAADKNRAGLPYLVLRVDAPQAGAWTIQARGDRRLHAAVVQTFDLRVTLDALPPVIPVGEEVEVIGRVRDGVGQPVEEAFTRKVAFHLRVRGPAEPSFNDLGPMEVRGPGEFRGRFTAGERGAWSLYGVATRADVLDTTTEAQRVEARGIKLRVELEPPTQRAWSLGDEIPVRARLVGGDGRPIEPTVAEAARVTLEARAPGESGFEELGTLRHVEGGRFEGSLRPQKLGAWAFYVVAASGDENRAQSATVEVQAASVRLKVASGVVDFGELRAGERAESTLDLSGSALGRDEPLRLDWSGVTSEQASISPDELTAAPGRTSARLILVTAEDHPDRVVEGEAAVKTVNPDAGGASARFKVRYTVRALSFWERWGAALLWALGVAAGIGGLIFVIAGFFRSHGFPAELRLFWGNDMERFRRNQVQLVKLPGGQKGWYRNARVALGGPRCAVGLGGPPRLAIEATSRHEILLRAEPGVVLERVSKFDANDARPVEGGQTPMALGQVFKLGDLFFKIE